MAVTQAERQRRLAEKKRDAGLLRLCRWVKPDQQTKIDAYLRGEAEIKLKVERVMGIDIDGKMLIGCWGDDVESDDLHAWEEENDYQVSRCSPHYDAGPEECFYGFEVESVTSDELSSEWLQELKDKAERFKELAGCKAVILIGMQNVW